MTRAFLGFFALVFLPYGLYCLAQPAALEGIAGVAATTATGQTELRAMYGGLQTGVGALMLAALVRGDWARPALLVLAFVGAGLASARLVGATLDGGWSAYTGMGLAFELFMAGGALALLRSEPAPG